MTPRHLHAAFALSLAALVGWAWLVGFGPSDTQAAIDSAAALRDAQGDAKRQSQFMATVRRVCGSDNANWTEQPDGGIQCRTKHGRATTKTDAASLKLAGGAP